MSLGKLAQHPGGRAGPGTGEQWEVPPLGKSLLFPVDCFHLYKAILLPGWESQTWEVIRAPQGSQASIKCLAPSDFSPAASALLAVTRVDTARVPVCGAQKTFV